MMGFSILFVIGKPVWIGTVECSWPLFRIVFGPFALWVVLRDMDTLAGKLLEIEKNGN